MQLKTIYENSKLSDLHTYLVCAHIIVIIVY